MPRPFSQLYLSKRVAAKLRAKLPKQLVLFDGKCPYSVAKVQAILLRNFNFFRGKAALERKQVHFASICSAESAQIKRAFPNVEEENLFIYVEKVSSPFSRVWAKRKTSKLGGLSFQDRRDSSCEVEDMSDVLVLVGSKAVFRVLMKLDTICLPIIGWVGYYFLPRWIGDAVFRWKNKRRLLDYVPRELDVFKSPKEVDGLPERHWRL